MIDIPSTDITPDTLQTTINSLTEILEREYAGDVTHLPTLTLSFVRANAGTTFTGDLPLLAARLTEYILCQRERGRSQ
jgi:hypothetical protein